MTDNHIAPVLDADERRRAERRRFLTLATSGAATVGGLALLSACGGSKSSDTSATPTPSPTASASSTSIDPDVLNFALNLSYLTAQYYSYAVYGTGLSAAQTSGIGTAGTVTGGAQVAFSDPLVAQYAREIAADKAAHVNYLRTALGAAAVAMPNINIDGGASGAFTAAARAAGLVGAGATFDPYASDENFLLGAFLFEDVGVTALKGAVPLLSSSTNIDAAAGVLAAVAYHAGLVRTTLYRKGQTSASLITQAGQLSDYRDSLDGTTDLDQGIASPDSGVTSNIVPADGSAIAYSRTTGQVLNIAYLTKAAANKGGFFPDGVNGNINTSTAEA